MFSTTISNIRIDSNLFLERNSVLKKSTAMVFHFAETLWRYIKSQSEPTPLLLLPPTANRLRRKVPSINE
jgi:hypothetical protein